MEYANKNAKNSKTNSNEPKGKTRAYILNLFDNIYPCRRYISEHIGKSR